jgi:signal transduction histidine kinase
LLSRLFLLVAVALLPTIAIQGYNEVELRRSRQVEIQDQALGLAKLAAAQQQRIVEGIREVLIALSELPSIKREDAAECRAYLSTLKDRYPAFLTFSVTDLSGRSFCDTTLSTSGIGATGRPYFDTALRTRAFTIGEYSIGRLSGRRAIHFALPYYRDGAHISGVIVAALSLDWLADDLARKGAPEGASIAIMDREGTYLARYPDNERFVSKKMPDAVSMSADFSQTVDRVEPDGVERIVAYAAAETEAGGILVSFGLDKARAFADIQRRTQRDVLLIVLSTSLVLVLTWLGARRFIHRPLGHLVEAANQWRLGDYGRRVHISERQSEIARVADAFNIMANTLGDRERQLRAAKENAEEAMARITTVFESTTDSVLVVGGDWRIQYLNERARLQVSGGRDLAGMDFWKAFPHPPESEIYQRYHAAMLDKCPSSFEMFSEQHQAWFSINVFPSNPGIAIYFRDITEDVRAKEARRLMEEQLHQSQKMEAIGQLTGGVAHDFNNVLTAISGNLFLIEDCASDSGSVRQFVAAARQAADRGAKLTGQLLAFSRRQRLSPKLVYADRLVREFEGLIRQAVGEACHVELVSREPLWPCYVDPAQLESALLNLAINGRDAMPDGGTLRIEMRNMIMDGRHPNGLTPGPYVALSVADTGHGMPQKILEQVFEPFFTTKGVGKGTGLGLSIVYGFVKQSGGDVAIQSAVGIGTTVTLYLPRAAQPCDAESEAVEPQAVAAAADSARILVVDDDRQVLAVTCYMLKALGHEVVTAHNGAEALGVLRGDAKIDILFSDVAMSPGMNGVELAREAQRLRGGIKVLLTSGHAEDFLARYGALDEFAVVRKPFSQADLTKFLSGLPRRA